VTAARLSPAALAALPAAVQRPAFDRSRLRVGIVHLGLGAFARAHLLACNDAALARAAADSNTDADAWGVLGVSLRHADVHHALQPQQGLYTLTLRDAHGSRTQLMGSLLGVLVAPQSPAAVLQALASPDTRVVSLTVTEKGYCHDPATRRLRSDHPDIVHDLLHPQAPRSSIGFAVHARRRAAGSGGLSLLSLDNLPANGDTLRGLVLAFAERLDAGLVAWIAAHCSFPNSMVDRIVPRGTEADRQQVAGLLGCDDAGAVVAEPYLAWAVEDRFVRGRPDWSAGGARWVPRAEPWERLKLRLLNGSHSAIAYAGVLAGWPTVDQAIAQPALRAFVQRLMTLEAAPTLAHELPGVDLGAYAQELLQRFDNPALAHRTAQIAMDGSQKLPQRLLAPLRERLAAGLGVEHLASAVALWLLHLRGHEEAGRSIALDDPLAPALQALWREAQALDDATERARALTRFAPVFGDLADAAPLLQALARAFEHFDRGGVQALLAGAGHHAPAGS
jgi:fructuronate reductase